MTTSNWPSYSVVLPTPRTGACADSLQKFLQITEQRFHSPLDESQKHRSYRITGGTCWKTRNNLNIMKYYFNINYKLQSEYFLRFFQSWSFGDQLSKNRRKYTCCQNFQLCSEFRQVFRYGISVLYCITSGCHELFCWHDTLHNPRNYFFFIVGGVWYARKRVCVLVTLTGAEIFTSLMQVM